MGLFSDKKKTVVNTTIQQVYADADLPNSARTAVIQSIFNGTGISENLLENYIKSMGVRADSAMNWAKGEGYFWGIPEDFSRSIISSKDAVIETMQRIFGAGAQQYIYVGPMNALHWAYQLCYDTWNWNPRTNELVGLSSVKSAPVYLKDIVPIYMKETVEWNTELDTNGLLENWGFSPKSGYAPSRPFNTYDGMGKYAGNTPYEVSEDAVEDAVRIEYEWKDSGGVIRTENVVMPMYIDWEADFHQARWRLINGNIRLFTYRQGLGTYPDIDKSLDYDFVGFGTYMPWAYFRYNKTPVTRFQLGDGWKDVVKYCNFFGVEAEEILKGVQADPGVDDVEQSMMIFGVNPRSQEQEDLSYLFEYTKNLVARSATQKNKSQSISDALGDFSNTTDQVFVIRDKYFVMKFSCSGAKFQRLAGSIGDVGYCTGARVNSSNNSGHTKSTQPAFRYQKQVLDSIYEEVHLFNPTLRYEVTHKKGYVAGINSSELLIPVDMNALTRLGIKEKETMLARSLHMVVNTVIEIKTPWYASSTFRIIMIVVAVVMNIFAPGSGYAVLAAAAAVGVTAVVWVIIQYVVTAMVISYAVKLFVKAVGPELAFLAALAAVAYGAYSTGAESAWAENLVKIGSNVVQESIKAESLGLQSAVQDLQTELLAQNELMQDSLDSLKETRKELGLDFEYTGLSGLDFVGYRPNIVLGESSESFYNRTVHLGNPGAMSLSLAEGFFDTKLTLPSVNDTVREV